MIRELVRLRERNQITLPAEIAEHLAVGPGALLELILGPEGDHIELRHAEVVRAGTPRAKQEEQAALEDIKQGRFSTFAHPEEMARDLAERRAKAEMQERIESLQQQVDGLMLYVKNMTKSASTVETLNATEDKPAVADPIQTG